MKCLSAVVLLFDVIFVLVSGVTLGGGLYMILGFEHINNKFAPTFDDAKKRLQKIIETINIYPGVRFPNPPNVTSSDPLQDIHFKGFVQNLGYALVVFSVIITTICILSVIGTCRKAKHVITAIIIVMILLVVVEFTWFIFFIKYRGVINKLVENYFKDDLNYVYRGIRSNDSFTIGWNIFMQKFNCCGVDSYHDFSASHSFNEIWGEPHHSFTAYEPYETAIACCDRIEVNLTIRPKFLYPCHRRVYTSKRGCLNVFWDAIDNYKLTVVACFTVMVLLQIIYVVANVSLRQFKRSNRSVEPDNNLSRSKKGPNNYSKHKLPIISPSNENTTSSRLQTESGYKPSSTLDLQEEKWYTGTRKKPMSRLNRNSVRDVFI